MRNPKVHSTHTASVSHPDKVKRNTTAISNVRVTRSRVSSCFSHKFHDKPKLSAGLGQPSNHHYIHNNAYSTIPYDMHSVPEHGSQIPLSAKTISNQAFEYHALSTATSHVEKRSASQLYCDEIRAKIASINTFKDNFKSTSTIRKNQIINNSFVLDICEKNTRRTSLTNTIKEKCRRRRRRRCCGDFYPCCSPCCCLIASLLLSITLAALAAIIVLLILPKTNAAITTTTSTTTTSVTTTTTTSATSSTTTSTSTSTTTSTTTQTTTSSTTSTSATTSTSTSTTSVTTLTTTTVTTGATTVTITSNACTSGWTGVTVLTVCTSCPNMIPYQQYTYSYVAIATQTLISFALREDVGFLALDDISVKGSSPRTVELIGNGGFETGSFSPWIYCNPAGASYAGVIQETSNYFSFGGQTYAAHSGTYYYCDGAVGYADYISQNFATNIGETYTISFWLFNEGSTSNSDVRIILSI
ncbi:unnamed protein product [Rotaria magnacalcarata]|uniref:Uncharacterized protein n=1 Tax=Rotaria magnacalcarata TaxID=392030 RepID=A0A815MVP5_9BILA|nr:unnamed protein product [Rotaria magnacalcarata]